MNTKPLTEVELEMMTILWKIEPCTVAQMLEKLPTDRPLAYTSVATIVRILEQKGFLKSQKENRYHIYSALVSKEEYEKTSLAHMIENVFDGNPSLLVKRLLGDTKLKQKNLDEIKKYIKEKA